MSAARKGSSSRGFRRPRTPFEWTILVSAASALLAIVVGLMLGAVRTTDGPPNLRATARATGSERSGGVPYEVTVHNRGGQTAENVEVEVTVGSEVRTVAFMAVARGDVETGVVIFPRGTSGEARAEVQSYTGTAR